jgi:hypothetical protein
MGREGMSTKCPALAASLLAAVFLSGCANGYKEFYKPVTAWTPEAIASTRVAAPPPTPLVERSPPMDGQLVLAAYAKRGYSMIGNSFFNSGRNETEEAAIHQGIAVGADLVLILNPRYTGSVTTAIPITTPTTTTAYSTGSATAYGAGGTVTAYGNGTTTVYGSQTNFVPLTINRSDYGAVYFIKQKFGFGAFFRDLNDAERQSLQTNKGAVVLTVVDDTPAFEADVLIGDIFTVMDGVPISGQASLRKMLKDSAGKLVTFELLRNGQKLEKRVQLKG